MSERTSHTILGLAFVVHLFVVIPLLLYAAGMPEAMSHTFLLLLPFAVFGISRAVAHEKITAHVRADAPRLLKPILSCSRCMGFWVALLGSELYILLPGLSVWVVLIFALAGMNMILQSLMALACAKTNRCELAIEREERP